MKTTRRIFLPYLILLLAAGLTQEKLFAADFGIILDNTAKYEEAGTGPAPAEKGSISPWLSIPINPRMDFSVSAAFTLNYENKEFDYYPELNRTEFIFRPASRMELKIGRTYYRDPLGFIAEGYFDGASFSMGLGDTRAGSRLSFGAYYSGFLYKETANITMDDAELAEYNAPLKWDNFAATYFAPKRLLVQAQYSRNGAFGVLSAALLAQLDLNGRASTYHSQYLILDYLYPYKNFWQLNVGATAEIIETSGRNIGIGAAAQLYFSWYLPTKFQDALKIGGKWASGEWNDLFRAFTPLTSETQGSILNAKLYGLMVLEADYTARLHKTLALNLNFMYFLRTDLIKYTYYPASSNNSYFLGGEPYAKLIWSPFSDLSLTLGGGAFLPMLGTTDPAAKIRWQASLNVILALY